MCDRIDAPLIRANIGASSLRKELFDRLLLQFPTLSIPPTQQTPQRALIRPPLALLAAFLEFRDDSDDFEPFHSSPYTHDMDDISRMVQRFLLLLSTIGRTKKPAVCQPAEYRSVERQPAECYFFDIPPELRIKIYKLALIPEVSTARTAHNGIIEPAILRSCKTIRLEARPLFYKSAIFHDPTGVDPAHALRLRRWTRKIRSEYGDVCPKLTRGGHVVPCWRRLIEYLRLVHAGQLNRRYAEPSMQQVPGHTADSMLVCAMFDQAEKLRALPWVEVKHQFEELHYVLVKLNGWWR